MRWKGSRITAQHEADKARKRAQWRGSVRLVEWAVCCKDDMAMMNMVGNKTMRCCQNCAAPLMNSDATCPSCGHLQAASVGTQRTDYIEPPEIEDRELGAGTTLALNFFIRFLPVMIATGGTGYLIGDAAGLLIGALVGVLIAGACFY